MKLDEKMIGTAKSDTGPSEKVKKESEELLSKIEEERLNMKEKREEKVNQ